MAIASLIGQPVHLLSPLVASTVLLCGLLNVDYGEKQKASIGWSVGTCSVMFVAAAGFIRPEAGEQLQGVWVRPNGGYRIARCRVCTLLMWNPVNPSGVAHHAHAAAHRTCSHLSAAQHVIEVGRCGRLVRGW